MLGLLFSWWCYVSSRGEDTSISLCLFVSIYVFYLCDKARRHQPCHCCRYSRAFTTESKPLRNIVRVDSILLCSRVTMAADCCVSICVYASHASPDPYALSCAFVHLFPAAREVEALWAEAVRIRIIEVMMLTLTTLTCFGMKTVPTRGSSCQRGVRRDINESQSGWKADDLES